MSDFISIYSHLIGSIFIASGIAFSQYIVLRAGVFSLASAGIASLGAYTSAILTVRYGLNPLVSLLASLLVGVFTGLVLSVPLSRLRGIFQAVASLAFVQIVISVLLFSETLTGGAFGLNDIPFVLQPIHLALFTGVVIYFLWTINRTSIGRAFNAIRQDEIVAVSLGISVFNYHVLAFAISGALAGLSGGLFAFHSYTIVPAKFGFEMLVAALAAVILGGRNSVLGPVVGAGTLTLLPELSRGFEEQRYLLYGALLVVVIIFLPLGIVDTSKKLVARHYAANVKRAES